MESAKFDWHQKDQTEEELSNTAFEKGFIFKKREAIDLSQ